MYRHYDLVYGSGDYVVNFILERGEVFCILRSRREP